MGARLTNTCVDFLRGRKPCIAPAFMSKLPPELVSVRMSKNTQILCKMRSVPRALARLLTCHMLLPTAFCPVHTVANLR